MSLNVDFATETALAIAQECLSRHPGDETWSRTFKYFTQHPVAPLNQQRLRAIVKNLTQEQEKLGRPLRVLDLCCGGGIISGALALAGCRVVGIDLDAAEIRCAREYAEAIQPKIPASGALHLIEADLLTDSQWETQATALAGGPFDGVLFAYALHHLPGVERFIERVSKIQPRPQLWINEENPEAPLFQLKHHVRTWIQKDTEIEWHQTFSAWNRLVSRYGWTPDSRPQGFDVIPGLSHLAPERCWSLFWSAR